MTLTPQRPVTRASTPTPQVAPPVAGTRPARPARRRRRARPEWEGRTVITVAALPGRGVYVRHLTHPEGIDGIHRPTVPPPGAGVRRPARFDQPWLADHLAGVDLVHVHGLAPNGDAARTAAAVDAVRSAGRPLVVTGYHLSDPSGHDPAGYAARLDALVPAADAVISLTEEAAAEMHRRWGVQAQVLPHPHAVDFVRMRQPRPPRSREGLLVGAHLGSLHGADPVPFSRALAAAAQAVPGSRLLVTINDAVLDSQSASFGPRAVDQIEQAVQAAGGFVRYCRPFTDAQLWDHLVSLGTCVLPSVPGSHSVWPEACFDLGTPIVLPAGSHAADQRACLTYDRDGDGPDVDSLTDALKLAAKGEHERATPAGRGPSGSRSASRCAPSTSACSACPADSDQVEGEVQDRGRVGQRAHREVVDAGLGVLPGDRQRQAAGGLQLDRSPVAAPRALATVSASTGAGHVVAEQEPSPRPDRLHGLGRRGHLDLHRRRPGTARAPPRTPR